VTPIKRAVSFAILAPNDPTRVLIVLRPDDDADLPNMWGLPAASLREAENWQEAVQRAGREKLGVELEIARELNRGEVQRADYLLQMRLYAARIVHGTPLVPQPHDDVTQYHDWKWDRPEVLQSAAELGSLCCRLFLDREQRVD
jgi:ADP-ribose pyrophosphatase YjhB (NUDIX family)